MHDPLEETLLWLCSIASPIGEERALCDAVQARVEKRDLAAPVRRHGDSIVVPLTRGTGGPKIALAGHLDTVRTENGPARIEGDRCFGAGSSDMKSGLALMVDLAEAQGAWRTGVDLTLVFYAREEGPYADNELGPVLERDPELRGVDLAVCLEPSDNKVHLGCMGSLHATVTFAGRTAHSARPWEGDNAVTQAAELLAALRAQPPVETKLEGLTYRSTTTVTQARDGGRGRNVVPDRFVMNLNHRFTPDRTVDEAEAHVRALVGAHAPPGTGIEIIDRSPAARPSAGHPLVRALVASGVRGVEPKQAWTDVARFAALGIAAVNFGPGENAQAHQRNESTSLPLLHEGRAILGRWLAACTN